jgi:hypothetical protein
MTIENVAGLIVSGLLLGYLALAIRFPKKF